jgi:molybdopterin synthase sulfur carrier subunit
MATLRLFAAAREAAGTGRDVVAGATVGEVLDAAVARYGPTFADVLRTCKVWRNGDEAERGDPCDDDDEVAVLPPVSGGAAPKGVEEQEARRLRTRAKAANRRRPIAVVYDIDGPRVRLGLVWFAVAVVGSALGALGLAGVYGLTAAIAAAQTARAWRKGRRRERPLEVVAAAAAVALPIAAALSTPLLGLTLLGVVAACIVAAGPAAGARTLQCALWPGAAAAAGVVSYRFEPLAAAALIASVSAYEVGDFLVGSGARNAVEGPVAGAAAVLVVGSSMGLLAFGLPDGVFMAVLAAALCPLGQLAASLVLPSARASASALRRLDSLLVLGPVWAYLAGQFAQP